jgi:UDP-glucose:(heptosyl)LPS alpha-1,3-glucosyltransferase
MTSIAQTGPAQKHVVISTRAVRPGAGSSRIVLALVGGLHAAGHRVDVVADRIAAEPVRQAGGRPCYPLGFPLLQRLGRRLLSRDWQLSLRSRAVSRLHADLVIGDGELRRQHVLLVHNIVRREVEELGEAATVGHERVAAAQEQALRSHAYDLVVANSELTRREFARRFGFPAGRIAVVHPGVDPGQFSRSDRAALRPATRRTLGLADDEVLVAFISSGHFILRGIDVLAGSLARLRPAQRRGVRLLCVGSDRNAELLRAEFARMGVEQAVISAPRVNRVEAYYHAADLLFHPAHFETFGLVVTEAAACGCPVLTSRSVGAAELFTGEAAAGVVARPDADQFAPLLGRLLAEPGFRTAVADSQHRAVGGHTWDAYTAQFLAVLRARNLL